MVRYIAYLVVWPDSCLTSFHNHIGHFRVVCLVTWPLGGSESGGNFVSIQTLLLFTCRSCCSRANYFAFTYEKHEVCIKTRSTPASLPLKGQVTRHATVKWTIPLKPWISQRSTVAWAACGFNWRFVICGVENQIKNCTVIAYSMYLKPLN